MTRKNELAPVYGTVNDLLFRPEPITAIVGRGRTGKTHLAARLYSAHLVIGIYDATILFDPYSQIDSDAGFKGTEEFLDALEQIAAENGSKPEAERKKILAIMDEADLIYDAWRRKGDFKEYLLRYNRHMNVDLVLTFRNIPKKDILLYANKVVLFQHYNKELDAFMEQQGCKLNPRDFPPRFFKIINL